jgi:hypothetical protein
MIVQETERSGVTQIERAICSHLILDMIEKQFGFWIPADGNNFRIYGISEVTD